MLNYETLLSSYDDKLTLMQWLKKVEAALKDASAVSFKVNKRGDATLTFSVVFEDGSELETDPIILQQGESVQSAYIQNGNLHLVLTNGDDLDAGNMFNGDVNVSGNIIATGNAVISGSVSTPILTSQNENIEAQKPVVEVMAGYAFTQLPQQYGTLSVSYAGAVKNGNKLTLAVAGTYEKASDGSNEAIGRFTIPLNVNAKLFPFYITGIGNVLEFKSVGFVDTSNGAILSPTLRLIKNQYGSLNIYIQAVHGLTTGHTYYFRYEVTFLLSDNLAA